MGQKLDAVLGSRCCDWPIGCCKPLADFGSGGLLENPGNYSVVVKTSKGKIVAQNDVEILP